MLQVKAYQIADGIDLKAVRGNFVGDLVFSDSEELFYRVDSSSYIYIFRYGVVSFLNFSDEEIRKFLSFISAYLKNTIEQRLSEDFHIEQNAPKTVFGFNNIAITSDDESDTFRIIMLNVSQSVALDYYSELTDVLLKETKRLTQELENKGKLDISGREMIKYIGKTLNLKNRISENLYIFDSPDETWENENLNKIDLGLKRTFDLQDRFRNIQEGLKIVTENLELFKDIMQYRTSNMLEWVIVVLIMVEVLNLFFGKFLK